MTNEQILKQAIEKAVNNGFKDGEYHLEHGVMGMCLSVIFSHDFAKAFWEWEERKGTDTLTVEDLRIGFNGKPSKRPSVHWQYHLQEMVLEKDPLQYLKKYL